MPDGWGHLARRFAWSLTARPLSDDERAEVRDRLGADLAAPFLAQPPVDQRHGLVSARWVEERTDDVELFQAALLHDVGKRHARLGVVGRSLATASSKLGGPLPGRFREYVDHGAAGAGELERLGAARTVIAFARHHHGRRPASIPAEAWDLLVRSDRVVVGDLRPTR